MYRLIKLITPPKEWRLTVVVALGIFAGLSSYAFYISKAHSYLSNKPEVCVNCHLMGTQYATWFHSSHRERATCNDCHVPHDNVARKYFFKAKDGMRHAAIFTMRMEPQTIIITDPSRTVVQENCIRCHTMLNENVRLSTVTNEMAKRGEGKVCWNCHREIAHGTVHNTSSTENAIVPLPESPVPEWLNELIKTKNKK